MKKNALLASLLLASILAPAAVWAQEEAGLHLLKTDINAESENAELCLEFDRPPAGPVAHLAGALHLESDGKNVPLPTLAASGNSVCLFPLEHGKNYRLDISGLRDGDDDKMAARKISFSVPDRTPSLSFTGKDGIIRAFDFYGDALNVRAVNVAHARLELYRLSDRNAMARAWQDRAQTSLAPSESAYLARNKGEKIWQSDLAFDASSNKVIEQKIALPGSAPDLAPGLYLLLADAGEENSKGKNLAPLSAVWFTKSDFSLQAVRDNDGIHVFNARSDAPGVKGDVHLYAFSKKPEVVAEAQSSGTGADILAAKPDADSASVLGIDGQGNVAFAAIDNLPVLSSQPAPGAIRLADVFSLPGGQVNASLSLSSAETLPAGASFMHVARGDFIYGDFPAAAVTAQGASLSFAAPSTEATWHLHWQKQDGAVLADAPLRITANGDAPHFEASSQRDMLGDDLSWPIAVRSVNSTGSPAVLAGGHVTAVWQRLDPAIFGWKDYHFGVPAPVADMPTPVGDFVTDMQGTAQLHITLPKPPAEHGLYQASLKISGDADAGIEDAAPVILPLRPAGNVIGIKPLAADARFPQNGIARFALIGIGGDGKARDIGGLAYQVYEEGRNFDWYQEDGRWHYKQEPQLRPIGGGALQIKADGSSQLEWKVTAGNYRLEILDGNGKILARSAFSASWDQAGDNSLPLAVSLPRLLTPGHEAQAHVILPEASMLTAIVADQHIRKIIHEFRPKGDTIIAFTPAADWQDKIGVSVASVPLNNRRGGYGHAEAALAQGKMAAPADRQAVSLLATEDPAALIWHKDGTACLGFALANKGGEDTYRYSFSVSPGVKIESGGSGEVKLGNGQSRALYLVLSAQQPGMKEIRLDVGGAKAPHVTRGWNITVLPQIPALRSEETSEVAPKQNLVPPGVKHMTADTLLLIARHPMDGLAEILSFTLRAHPFTTAELATQIEALRLWGGIMTQMGLAPDGAIAARRQEQIAQLLRHQNEDGGFAPWRGGDTTPSATAAALTALGPDTPAEAVPAKNRAILWIKQRLANDWIDEKERPPRAEALAALAAADAVDAAAVHYFSDTSAEAHLPAIAEADMAAAFKHIRDPDAAAFWIKKMLDENGHSSDVALLNALSATDALPSDDVHAAMAAMVEALRRGKTPDMVEAAQLLRALAADNKDAGKGHVASAHDIRDVSGLLAMRGNEAAAYANTDTQPLYVTFAVATPAPGYNVPAGFSVTRHVYRLNGVELPPAAKLAHGDLYLVELKGDLGTAHSGQLLVQDGGAALRPAGCPLSAGLDTLSFMPWFSSKDLTPVDACAFSAHRIDALLAPDEEANSFTAVYFARIDAASLDQLPAPRLRVMN